MSNEKLYIIYRVYNKKDRPDNDVGPILYGWSNNKNVVKAFMNQRDKNKYYVEKMSDANINEIMEGSYNDLDVNNMIEYIKLISYKTHKEICLFMRKKSGPFAGKWIPQKSKKECFFCCDCCGKTNPMV